MGFLRWMRRDYWDWRCGFARTLGFVLAVSILEFTFPLFLLFLEIVSGRSSGVDGRPG